MIDGQHGYIFFFEHRSCVGKRQREGGERKRKIEELDVNTLFKD